MHEVLKITQEAFSLNDPHLMYQAIGTIRDCQRLLQDEVLAQSRACERLLRIRLSSLNGLTVGHTDVLALLRQIARYFGSFQVSLQIWQELSSEAQRFSLTAFFESPETATVIAQDWTPNWLADTYEMDALIKRRSHNPVPADGTLYDMMQPIDSYQSEGQRQAVQAVLFAQPASTTLVTLPTGAGKSLCMYLPAWVASHGSKSSGGTILVIVPTVALAIDQSESARRYFRNSDPLYQPYYLASDTPTETRGLIRQGIQKGTIPLLFLSPESLLGSSLTSVLLDAAKEGRVNQVVVDEAHLIESWGVFFRSDFQMLATYFRTLHQVSPNGIKILLLSATISQPARETLEYLFTLPNGDFVQVQVNQLRPEIAYWMATVYEPQKLPYIAEALRHLPRPAILYLTSPDDAERWYRYLLMEGYERMATFTGETVAQERLDRIRKWRENEIDLMIATSAFGLGVDKPDVRTVIHATFPENIDRFYQEVGRGGRDGCSSISLLIAAKHDLDYAFSNALKSRITPEIAWQRWQSMFERANRQDGCWLINRQMTREYGMRESSKNQDWNDHVLLLMQRARMIRIADLSPSELEGSRNQIKIEILQEGTVNSEEGFKQIFEPVRQLELERMRQSAQHFVQTFQDQVISGTQCLAYAFEQVYVPVGLACGGCPACRRARRRAYHLDSILEVTAPQATTPNQLPSLPLVKFMGHQKTLHLIGESTDEFERERLHKLVRAFIKYGVVQIILPSSVYISQAHTVIKQLKDQAYQAHLLLHHDEVSERVLYNVPTACILGNSTSTLDRFYQRFDKWRLRTQNHVIYVVPRALELPSLHGRFIDRVVGHQSSVKQFLAWQDKQEHTL